MPLAVTVKLAVLPAVTLIDTGCVTMTGAVTSGGVFVAGGALLPPEQATKASAATSEPSHCAASRTVTERPALSLLLQPLSP